MINSKKGLSTVVTTLIIILLVLVAIGIIWVVISNVISEGTQSADWAVKCLEVSVKATSVTNCISTSCDVTLSRTGSGDAINGVKLVFRNETSGSSDVLDYPNNIGPLETVTASIAITGLSSDPDLVEVTPYFLDESRNVRACQTNSLSF